MIKYIISHTVSFVLDPWWRCGIVCQSVGVMHIMQCCGVS